MARMAPKPKPTPTVTIPSNFDPTALGNNQFASKPNAQPVPKEDLIFDVSASNLFEKVIASPEPVLLDVFAVWCGPCKALTPALEQLVGKGNGLLVRFSFNNNLCNAKVPHCSCQLIFLLCIRGLEN